MGSRKEELSAAHDTITQLQVKLEEAKGEPLKFNEKEREAQEKKTKDAEKKADEAKRAAKLKKKEKLSDILMAHGAEFLAMKAAKDNADAGDKKQKDEVTKAAKSGARAGAVGPLRKVARAAAVAAVKKSRAEAKKDKRNDKAKIREITTAAAQVAVKKLLAEQEELVEKTVKTVTAKAIKKYPPASIFLSMASALIPARSRSSKRIVPRTVPRTQRRPTPRWPKQLLKRSRMQVQLCPRSKRDLLRATGPVRHSADFRSQSESYSCSR